MTDMIPAKKPEIGKVDAQKHLAGFSISAFPVCVLGIRGYFDSIKEVPTPNQIGIYDDAIMIISPDFFATYNANTDPSRLGSNIAQLKLGGPYMYKLGIHGMHHLNLSNPTDEKVYNQLMTTKENVPTNPLTYWALRQFGNVTVIRDGKEQTDNANNRFFIDIHKGGYHTTSSEGCQTIHPDQWISFYSAVKTEMKKYNQDQIPYCLVQY